MSKNIAEFHVISVSGRKCRLETVDPVTIKSLDALGVIRADCAFLISGLSAIEYEVNGRSTIVAVEQKEWSPGDVLVHLPVGTFTLYSMTKERAQKIVGAVPGLYWEEEDG